MFSLQFGPLNECYAQRFNKTQHPGKRSKGVKLRYAPTDALLKTLLFANVEKRAELFHFLETLYRRYGLVFGDREAEHILAKGDLDKKAFQANSRRLEQRLGSLGLLRRLSDGCAYVVNPYFVEEQ